MTVGSAELTEWEAFFKLEREELERIQKGLPEPASDPVPGRVLGEG